MTQPRNRSFRGQVRPEAQPQQPAKPPAQPWDGGATGGAAAKALVQAGLVQPGDEGQAATILSHYVQPPKLDFASDMAFLRDSIEHHATVYMRTVLVPLSLTTMNARDLGRVIKDEEVRAAASELTEKVVMEMGSTYATRIAAYVGHNEGLIAYVYERMYDMLYQLAVKQNEDFIKSRVVSLNTARVAATLQEQQ